MMSGNSDYCSSGRYLTLPDHQDWNLAEDSWTRNGGFFVFLLIFPENVDGFIAQRNPQCVLCLYNLLDENSVFEIDMAPFQCDNVRDSQSTGIIGKEEHIEDSQSPDIVNCTIQIFNSGYLILIKISHFFFFSFAFILSCLGIKIGFGYGCRCLGV